MKNTFNVVSVTNGLSNHQVSCVAFDNVLKFVPFYFICLCNSESPLDAAIMERKCNWHFRVETCNTHDECNRYEACMKECENTLNLNKSGCTKICSHWKN